MEKFTNTNLSSKLAERASLTPDFIKAENLTKEEVKAYNEALKVAKRNDKLSAFKVENCTIEYNKKVVKINPCLTVTDSGKSLVIFKDISSDAYVVISAGKDLRREEGDAVYFDHFVKIDVVKRVTDGSNKADVKEKIVKLVKSFLVSLLKDVTAGVSFEQFYDAMTAYNNKKDIKCPRVLKGI